MAAFGRVLAFLDAVLPAIRHLTWATIAVLTLAFGAFALYETHDPGEEGRCLDHGGSWSKVLSQPETDSTFANYSYYCTLPGGTKVDG